MKGLSDIIMDHLNLIEPLLQIQNNIGRFVMAFIGILVLQSEIQPLAKRMSREIIACIILALYIFVLVYVHCINK